MAAMDGLAEKLKTAGCKLTPARLAIVDVLENSSEHLSHDQILELGKKAYPKLSRATVYRTTELLVELGLLRPLYLQEPTQRFVSAFGGHHHLVCTRCGITIEFDSCHAGELASELAAHHNFQIKSHLLEFHGLCRECCRSDREKYE